LESRAAKGIAMAKRPYEIIHSSVGTSLGVACISFEEEDLDIVATKVIEDLAKQGYLITKPRAKMTKDILHRYYGAVS
jgi:hypothetical protein